MIVEVVHHFDIFSVFVGLISASRFHASVVCASRCCRHGQEIDRTGRKVEEEQKEWERHKTKISVEFRVDVEVGSKGGLENMHEDVAACIDNSFDVRYERANPGFEVPELT